MVSEFDDVLYTKEPLINLKWPAIYSGKSLNDPSNNEPIKNEPNVSFQVITKVNFMLLL